MKALVAGLVVLMMASGFVINGVGAWNISDDEYSIKFDTRMVHGTMKGLSGDILFDQSNLPQSGFKVKVDARTIDTGIRLKNKHAKSKGFLDVETYPFISYRSLAVTKSDSGFVSNGELTIKDVTKPVVIPFTFSESNGQGVFKGRFDINREDYHLYRWGIGKVLEIDLVVPVKR